MQFVLRIDTCAPGSTSKALTCARAQMEARPAPSAFALEAAWTTEFGETDQVVSLSSGSDDASPNVQSVEAQDAPPFITRSDRRLQLEAPFDRNFSGGHIYDMRVYTLHSGTRELFMRHMLAALATRKQFSRNVGVWTPLSGNRDQVIHIWAYRDLAERNAARVAAWKEPSWRHYLEQIFPLMSRMQNALLVPADFSPMQ